MSLHVHLTFEPAPDALMILKARTDDDIHITTGDSPDEATYNVLVAGRPSRDALDASPNLHTLIIPFAGLPASTRETMRDYPDIAIHNLHHNAPATAEMALSLLLAVAKYTVPTDRTFRQHDWTPRYEPAPLMLLRDKTALILGYGAVGQYLGAILKAMGMNVNGIRRTQADEDKGIYTTDALEDLLPDADVLIVALPATAETEGLIGQDELDMLPETAIVINVGRGMVIDQHALYETLKDEYIFGAGLDVWYNYPDDEESRTHTPPADVPFHELDNVVLSPHRAGGGRHYEIEHQRMIALAQMLNQIVRGEQVAHQVDLDAGY